VHAAVPRASKPRSGRLAVLVLAVDGAALLAPAAVDMRPWWNLHISVKVKGVGGAHR
jgi:hypothetical protein